jgi:hypothetical protein
MTRRRGTRLRRRLVAHAATPYLWALRHPDVVAFHATALACHFTVRWIVGVGAQLECRAAMPWRIDAPPAPGIGSEILPIAVYAAVVVFDIARRRRAS